MPKQDQPKPKRVKTTLYLPEDLWKAAKIKAIETDVDATDIVTTALERYLNKGGAR